MTLPGRQQPDGSSSPRTATKLPLKKQVSIRHRPVPGICQEGSYVQGQARAAGSKPGTSQTKLERRPSSFARRVPGLKREERARRGRLKPPRVRLKRRQRGSSLTRDGPSLDPPVQAWMPGTKFAHGRSSLLQSGPSSPRRFQARSRRAKRRLSQRKFGGLAASLKPAVQRRNVRGAGSSRLTDLASSLQRWYRLQHASARAVQQSRRAC